MIHYKITVYGIKEVRNKIENFLLNEGISGINIAPLVEDGVYGIYKEDDLAITEVELLKVTKQIAKEEPECEIFTEVVSYDPETTAKTIEYQVKYENRQFQCLEYPYGKS